VNPSHPEAPQRKTVGSSLQIRGKALTAICSELKRLLADIFALYIKTKYFCWHMTGPHFHDYHRLLDGEAGQLLAMTDPIAERSRILGGDVLYSVGDIVRHQRVTDCDQKGQPPRAMFAELLEDNRMLADNLRTAHIVCEQFGDVPTASLIENWIDETDHRIWILRETVS
jgi:starvation-inducible DNA-binding protein